MLPTGMNAYQLLFPASVDAKRNWVGKYMTSMCNFINT